MEGYAVRFTDEELALYEKSSPPIFSKTKVQLKQLPYKDGDPLEEGLVFIMIDKQLLSMYKRPSPEYLDAVCKTLSAGMYLR